MYHIINSTLYLQLPCREPPKDTPFKPSELAAFNGSDSSKPIYVAIKGIVYDVTKKPEMYGAGSGYNCFAGKDASKVSLLR